MRLPVTRCIRLSSVSSFFCEASVTLAVIGSASPFGAQIRLREGDQDRAVVVAAGEVDVAD